MRQVQERLEFEAPRQGLLEITSEVQEWVSRQDVRQGLLTIYLRHTSASLLIQENADPDVLADLENFFDKLVPEELSLYRHIAEGPDDMPAHIKGALTQTHLAIPIEEGQLLLGTWQGLFLFEHRRRPRQREVVLHFAGE